MKKVILVTGGEGFISEYFIREMSQYKDVTLISIDNQSKSHHPAYEDSYEKCLMIKGDVRNTAMLLEVMETYQVNAVVNFAALIGGILYFHKIPYDILSENNQITSSVIDACLRMNVEHFINVSSSMVYESATQFPVHEGDELLIPPPITSYGYQKLSTEYYVRAAAQQYRLNYTIVRPFNAVAPGEWAKPGEPGYSHVIPDAILKTQQSTGTVEILGDGHQVRCFTHCEDIARGIRLILFNQNTYGQSFNLVNPVPYEMRDIFEMVWRKMRGGEQFQPVFVPGLKHDVKKRVGDCTKAMLLLGWKPEYGVEQIVDEMIAYAKGM